MLLIDSHNLGSKDSVSGKANSKNISKIYYLKLKHI